MKIIVYILLTSYPSLVGYVNDFAGCVPSDYERKITSVILEVKEKTGAEIAVVTIPTTGGEDITMYSVNLYTEWGIGEKGKDNGVLITVAMDDKRTWITTGYGLEGIIPDATAGDIWRNIMRPLFKEGNYGGGILNGVIVIAEIILKEHGQTLSGGVKPDISYKQERERGCGVIGLPILFLLFLIFGWRIIPFLLLGRMVGYWSGGSFGGSGGFGGGFGGFGGGATGGGGAGGGW